MGEPLWRQMLAGVLCGVLGHRRVSERVYPLGDVAKGLPRLRFRCTRRGCMAVDVIISPKGDA